MDQKPIPAPPSAPSMPQSSTPQSSSRGNLTKSVLAQDVEITGSLTFKGELSFDGNIKGGHIAGSVLNLGEHANVEGNITADEVTISGTVKGNATVSQRCHLRASAR